MRTGGPVSAAKARAGPIDEGEPGEVGSEVSGQEELSKLRRKGGPEAPQVRRLHRCDCELPAAWWVEGEGVDYLGAGGEGGGRPPEAHPSPQPSTIRHFFSSISGSEGQPCGLRLIQEILPLQDGVRRAAVRHADDLSHLKAQKPENLGEVVGGLLEGG